MHYPPLTDEDIKAALAYFEDRLRREESRRFDLVRP